MREQLLAALATHQQRARWRSLAFAVLVGTAAAAIVAITVSSSTAAVVAFAIVTAGAAYGWWRRSTSARVAAAIEARVPRFDNLLVTAEEVLGGRRAAVHPVLQDELFREAALRLARESAAVREPLALIVALAGGAVVALTVLLITAPAPELGGPPSARQQGPLADTPRLEPGDLRVVVTPPAYSGRAATQMLNPTTLIALEGSRVRLEVAATGGAVRLVDADLRSTAFRREADRWAHELIATRSRPLVIEQQQASAAGSDRLVHLRVEPDTRPLVRIRRPAKDLLFPEARGEVPVEIEARDDVGLASLQLRYTRVSGSGETFTFQEGNIPVSIERSGDAAWNGRATLTLDALKLQDGDTVVYRAIAADRKPGADPSASDAFLIEIGRLAGAASTGFAVDEEQDRQAISQQMLIIKTERLHAERAKLSPDVVREQTQLLAVEQRMVRAEFVFMTGGEVEDEVEEATHAHELAEGRLENQGQNELLAAIREMSRAEARLNAADTAQALVFERAALRALQRAFDRRRYLLRSLPERTRIDATRRLSGDLSTARSSRHPAVVSETDDVVVRARQLMSALGARQEGGALLASRLLAIDPDAEALQKAALQLSSARDDNARVVAAREAQRILADFVKQRLRQGASGRVQADPLHGRLADEIYRKGGVR